MHDSASPAGSLGPSSFDDLVEEITSRLQQGLSVDLDAYASRLPERADELRRLWPALAALASAGDSDPFASDSLSLRADQPNLARQVLGDYRIMREIGRGGMGVVYLAEQISLGRQVALKMLSFAGAMDNKRLARFKNEALAAAQLDHPHIVDVHGVGLDRGIHYYVMRYIDGRSLAEVIDLLQPAPRDNAPPPAGAATEDCAAADPNNDERAAATVAKADFSTMRSGNCRDYFRTVARLGMQAAEALEHAHEQGIMHRDIKPANLLLDGRGNVWIADFGLARILSEATLTATGDFVGTLRYMSPEAALAKRTMVDHRADVYSLGATLYELLTLRPPFAGADREELLRQIATEEPMAPRRIDPHIPAELETIVLKALEKQPADRYANSQALADDLRRYLEDRPIQARKPSLWQRARKWSRRHKPVVTAGLVCLAALVAAVTGSVGWSLRDRAARSSMIVNEASLALTEARRVCDEGKFAQALAIADRAAGMLETSAEGTGKATGELREEIDALRRALTLAMRLDAATLVKLEDEDTHFESPLARIEAALQEFGLAVGQTEIPTAAERIQSCPPAVQLVALSALDQWVHISSDAPEMKSVVAWFATLLHQADQDEWRRQVRQGLEGQDWPALLQLAQSADAAVQPPYTLGLLGNVLAERAESRDAGIDLLLRTQRQYPGDYWLNVVLAERLAGSPPLLPEAVRFATVAAGLRPDDARAQRWLGWKFGQAGRYDDAVALHRRALELGDDSHEVHCAFGYILIEHGLVDQGIAECRKAIELNPNCHFAHGNIGHGMVQNGDMGRAVESLARAVQLAPQEVVSRVNLGAALTRKGDLNRAETELRTAIELDGHYADAHHHLADLLKRQRQFVQAIAEFRLALLSNSALPGSHCLLGDAHIQEGDFSLGLEHLKKGHELGAKEPKWDLPSAESIARAERLIELEAELPDVLAERRPPASPGERAEYADVCGKKKLYATAARLYAQAFAEDATVAADLKAGHRQNAARAAVRAAAAEGADAENLDDAERARLRSQALDWLRVEVASAASQLSAGKSTPRDHFARLHDGWRREPDLASIRDNERLAALTSGEQQAWQAFWSEAASLAEQATAAAAAPQKVERWS